MDDEPSAIDMLIESTVKMPEGVNGRLAVEAFAGPFTVPGTPLSGALADTVRMQAMMSAPMLMIPPAAMEYFFNVLLHSSNAGIALGRLFEYNRNAKTFGPAEITDQLNRMSTVPTDQKAEEDGGPAG